VSRKRGVDFLDRHVGQAGDRLDCGDGRLALAIAFGLEPVSLDQVERVKDRFPAVVFLVTLFRAVGLRRFGRRLPASALRPEAAEAAEAEAAEFRPSSPSLRRARPGPRTRRRVSGR
jgi:hypothetical protein